MNSTFPELVMFDLNLVIEDSSKFFTHLSDIISELITTQCHNADISSVSHLYTNPLTSGTVLLSQHLIFWRKLLSKARGIPDWKIEFAEVHEIFEKFIRRCVQISTVYPEVINVLSILRSRGIKLALVSNGNAYRVEAFLTYHALRGIFDITRVSGEMPYGKPHPILFESVLAQTGIKPWQAIMVGDRPDTDIAGANNCGLWTCKITRSANERFVNTSVDEPPDFCVSNLSSIMDIQIPNCRPASLDTVILLAGGKGTRMGNVKNGFPKVLLNFGNGMNSLEWHLLMWEGVGVRRIIILPGPGIGCEKIEDYIAERYTKSSEVIVPRVNEAGTAKAMSKIADLLPDVFIFAHVDILYQPRLIAKVVKYSIKFCSDVILAVCDGRVAPTHAGVLLGINGEPAKGFVFPENKGDYAWSIPVSLGLGILQRSVLPYFPMGKDEEMIEHGIARWSQISGHTIQTVSYSEDICHIVCPTDLYSANRFTTRNLPKNENAFFEA